MDIDLGALLGGRQPVRQAPTRQQYGEQVLGAGQLIAAVQQQAVQIQGLEQAVSLLQQTVQRLVANNNAVVKALGNVDAKAAQAVAAASQAYNGLRQVAAAVQQAPRALTVKQLPRAAPAPQQQVQPQAAPQMQPQVIEAQIVDDDGEPIDPGDGVAVVIDDNDQQISFEDAMFHGLIDEEE